MTIDKLQNLDTEYDQVFLIDCLPENEYNEWRISQDLMKFLADNGVIQTASICRTKKLVLATLHYLLKIANSGTKFCLHIVSHGDETGLWVKTTDEDIFWADFIKLLEQINDAMGRTLLVNMTSCRGLHGMKIVDEYSDNYPFFGLIGYSDDLDVVRGKDINRRFYTKIIDGKEVQLAVSELRNELNDDKLYCMTSESFKIIKNTLSKHK